MPPWQQQSGGRNAVVTFLVGVFIILGCTSQNHYQVEEEGVADSTRESEMPVDWPRFDDWERGAEAPSDVAVIVAIQDYLFLPPVVGATESARDWENFFREGRSMSDVFVVTDHDASREEILSTARKAADAARGDGKLWFVFIGHGSPALSGEDGMLVGMDAKQTPDSLGARSVLRDEIVRSLESGAQSETIVVFDTCFSGRAPDGEQLAVGTQPVLPITSQAAVSESTVVLSAARHDEFAGQLPGLERPAFSYLLLGALRGWADDGDGVVSAGEAVDFAKHKLRFVTGRTQTPTISGNSEVGLTYGAAESDPGVQSLLDGRSERLDSASVGSSGHRARINTNAGLVFTHDSDWSMTEPGFGRVLEMNHTYSGNEIWVHDRSMSRNEVGDWISDFNREPLYPSARVIERFSPRTIGNKKGSYGEFYGEGTDSSIVWKWHVFVTHHVDRLWVFEFKVRNDGAAEQGMPYFEELIATAEFR